MLVTHVAVSSSTPFFNYPLFQFVCKTYEHMSDLMQFETMMLLKCE